MALIIAKFIDKDSQSLEANGATLRVKVDGSTIERTASGLAIVAGGVTADEIGADAVGDSELDTTDNYNFTGTLQYGGVNVATETYVNNAVQGIDHKDNVKVASTTNLTLSGEQTIDGVLTSTSRILVKDQTAPEENGIYVTASGAWSRANDVNVWDELVSAFVFVDEGTTNKDLAWHCTVDTGGTLGVTAVTWQNFPSATTVTAGAGLTKTGNTIDVIAGDTSLTVSADSMIVNVDDVTIETVAGGIAIKDDGVDENKIISTSFGSSITGGSGTTIDVDVSTFLSGAAFEIDGDLLDVDYAANNYTPSATTVAGHLAGLDTAVGSINSRVVETFTLDGTDISNKYVTLSSTPAAAGRVILLIKSAPGQHYGDDYQMDGSNPDRLTWNGLSLDGVFASGDKFTVEYDI